jgi:hypothetical protein
VKYVNYIINGRPLQPERLISEGSLRVITIIVVIVPSMIGFIFISGLVPFAWAMDSGRLIKLRYLLFKKKQRKLNYIRNVLISLGHDNDKESFELLKAA